MGEKFPKNELPSQTEQLLSELKTTGAYQKLLEQTNQRLTELRYTGKRAEAVIRDIAKNVLDECRTKDTIYTLREISVFISAKINAIGNDRKTHL